jgi:hypothetical protein
VKRISILVVAVAALFIGVPVHASHFYDKALAASNLKLTDLPPGWLEVNEETATEDRDRPGPICGIQWPTYQRRTHRIFTDSEETVYLGSQSTRFPKGKAKPFINAVDRRSKANCGDNVVRRPVTSRYQVILLEVRDPKQELRQLIVRHNDLVATLMLSSGDDPVPDAVRIESFADLLGGRLARVGPAAKAAPHADSPGSNPAATVPAGVDLVPKPTASTLPPGFRSDSATVELPEEGPVIMRLSIDCTRFCVVNTRSADGTKNYSTSLLTPLLTFAKSEGRYLLNIDEKMPLAVSVEISSREWKVDFLPLSSARIIGPGQTITGTGSEVIKIPAGTTRVILEGGRGKYPIFFVSAVSSNAGKYKLTSLAQGKTDASEEKVPTGTEFLTVDSATNWSVRIP